MLASSVNVSIPSFLSFLLVVGAGYWLVTQFVPKIRKEVLESFLSNEQLSSGLTNLVTLTIIVLTASAALSQLSSAIIYSDISPYFGALTSPLSLLGEGIGALWSLLQVGALVFIGLAVYNSAKK